MPGAQYAFSTAHSNVPPEYYSHGFTSVVAYPMQIELHRHPSVLPLHLSLPSLPDSPFPMPSFGPANLCDKSFGICTYQNRAHLPRTSSRNPFRINTCKSVSKQTTLTLFRINTYKKHRGWGVLLLTRHPAKGVCPGRPSGARDLSSFPTSGFVLTSAATGISLPKGQGVVPHVGERSHTTSRSRFDNISGASLLSRTFDETRHFSYPSP